MIYWIPMYKSQSNVNSIPLLYDGRRFIDAIFKCIPSVKNLWCFGFELWMTFVSRGTTLVWKMACHHFGAKPLSKRVLTKLTVTNMSCANITTNIFHNINSFQTQNMKQYWQKRSGKGRNMILIRSGKGRNIILIRAQLNRGKILLIADGAQIDRLLVLWRAYQERVGRDKSVSRTQLDRH